MTDHGDSTLLLDPCVNIHRADPLIDDADEPLKTPLSGHVEQALSSSGVFLLGQLMVNDFNGCIRLRGRVDTWYLKQLAQEVSMRVEGTRSICNDIEVASRV